jgi:hypothetical protein
MSTRISVCYSKKLGDNQSRLLEISPAGGTPKSTILSCRPPFLEGEDIKTILLAWPSIKHSPGRSSQKYHITITEQLSYVNFENSAKKRVGKLEAELSGSRGTTKLLGSKSLIIWWLLFQNFQFNPVCNFWASFQATHLLEYDPSLFDLFSVQSLSCTSLTFYLRPLQVLGLSTWISHGLLVSDFFIW